MKVIKEKHAFLMRWTHWVNFPVLAIMIWSGLFIYWANDAYGISIFGFTLIKFFPSGFTTTSISRSDLPKAWPFIFCSCGSFSSMDYYISSIPFLAVPGEICFPTSTLLRRPGKSFFTISTSER